MRFEALKRTNRGICTSLGSLKNLAGSKHFHHTASATAGNLSQEADYRYSLPRTQRVQAIRHHTFSSQTIPLLSKAKSPFDASTSSAPGKSKSGTKRRKYVPRKAAVKLTEKARKAFKTLLEDPPRPEIIGVMLNYQQSNTGEPRMVFRFDFVTAADIDINSDEGVSLEVVTVTDKDGQEKMIPKPPEDSMQDGLPKLYIHHNAFLKVLGATVDLNVEEMTPILYDREGNVMDPNA